jgi:prepilin-type N-terminal cleavage/methylation domain-containing protein
MILKRRKAFTLIELLVVISIIALLMAIIMPALNKARAQARKLVCGSNFRQLGSVYHMYANDHGQWIPRTVPLESKDNVFKFGTAVTPTVSRVLPYAIGDNAYWLLRRSYGLSPEIMVCPTKLHFKNTSYFQEKGDEQGELYKFHDDGSATWVAFRWLGIARLNGMVGMWGTRPNTVSESAVKVTDRGDKILAADENVVWDQTLQHHRSRLAHTDGRGLPTGSNRLQLDGAVLWFSSNQMAEDNTPLTEDPHRPGFVSPYRSRPRYDHIGNLQRLYYW